MKHFKLHSIDSGFDRIYYQRKNKEGRDLLYCLQDSREIKLYRCSRDGEPDHELDADLVTPCTFDLPTGESELELSAIAWIKALTNPLKPIQPVIEEITPVKLNTIAEIWDAIDRGTKVYCSSTTYEIIPVDSTLNKYSELSFRDGKALRVTCVSNYFGSLIGERDLSHCFTLGGQS